MLDITILAIGKIKEKNYRELTEEYLKRLSPNAIVKIEELKSEPFYEGTVIEKVKDAESEKLIAFLEKCRFDNIFILDERGREYTSEEFSDKLQQIVGKTVFVIGGALGMNEKLLNYTGAERMALSKMTFLHEMTRVILLEQIYRAVAIMRNKRYHY